MEIRLNKASLSYPIDSIDMSVSKG